MKKLRKTFEHINYYVIDGNGDFDDKDRYAFVGLDGILRLASGVELNSIVKDKNDSLKLNISDTKFINTIGKLRDFATQYENDIYDPRTDKNTGGDSDKAVFRLFMNDQAMFYVHGLGSAQMFRDMKSDFGVIPTPKLDETQVNYFVTPDETKHMVIPASASDLDRTAIILEALAYEGYTYLRPLYYETMLQSKYLRDEESVEMLDEYIYKYRFFTKFGQRNIKFLESQYYDNRFNQRNKRNFICNRSKSSGYTGSDRQVFGAV